jgi:hypothetical protein
VLAHETLGGIETASLQMSVGSFPHATRIRLVSHSGIDPMAVELEEAVIEASNRNG